MNKKFFGISAVVLIVMIILNLFDLCSTACLSFLTVVFTIIPAFIAWFCEKTSLKTFCSEYLSIRQTDWRKSMSYVAITGILCPIAIAVYTMILSFFSNDSFGISLSGSYNLLNIATFELSNKAELIYAILATIAFVIIAGCVSGVINTIFEEVAWRGFLNKHLALRQSARIIIISIIWTVWMVAAMPNFSDTTQIILLFAFNLAMSLYLEKVVEQTHSVWASGMLRGVVDLSVFMPVIAVENNIAFKLITICAILTIALISKLILCKSTGNR